MIQTHKIQLRTQGHCDVIDITPQVSQALKESGLSQGTATVFVSGSTAGITTMEYEPGLVADLKALFQRLAPVDMSYQHDLRWGDGNGYSHIRASLLGASLVVPFEAGRLLLGTWQQIVLVDFDNRPRSREVIVQFLGE